MKRFELTFTFLQLPIDYLMLILAGFSAYSLRYAKFVTAVRPILFNLPWHKYWPAVVLVAAGWIIIFAFSGLYNSNPNRKLSSTLLRVITACSTGFAGITIYVFFTLQKFDSRFLVLAGWILAMLFVAAARILTRGLKSLCYRWGIGLRRTVIIGSEAVADIIKATLKHEPRLGYGVVATFPHFDAGALAGLATKLDEIIFTDPKANEEESLKAMDFASERHITFKYSADLFATIASNMAISTIAGVPIIELRRTRLAGWGRIIKRLTDIIFSILLMIVLSPIYLIIALFILIETGRPIIYKNERVGQYGKNFFTLKFRSMFQKDSTGEQFGPSGVEALKREAELIKTQSVKEGPLYKIKDDPRVTKFGRWLRRWSLDELPNFWNVFKGEMSLVGPRPHQVREVAGYEKQHKIVFTIKPGVTGLAQISGRSDLNFEDEIKLDVFYMENWSLYLDLIILVKTPFIVLLRKGAW